MIVTPSVHSQKVHQGIIRPYLGNASRVNSLRYKNSHIFLSLKFAFSEHNTNRTIGDSRGLTLKIEDLEDILEACVINY